MPKLTIKYVEALEFDPKRQVVWDSDLRGFGLRVTQSGRKTYVVQYRNARGRSRRMTLGEHGILTPTQARDMAREVLGEVRRGNDPVEEKAVRRQAPNVSDLCARYLTEHADTRKKPKSIDQDRRMIDRFILPELGKRKVADVTRADVYALHRKLRDTAYQANRVLALLSKMMNLAEMWGLRPDGSNPCRHVQKYPERRRERFLSPDEWMRLGAALEAVEAERSTLPSIVPAIRLLIFTGCRLSEILELRWEHVDLGGRVLRLPDSKTGAKNVHLSAAAVEILAGLEPRPEGWVIEGARPDRPLVNLEKPWRRIRTRADLSDVRLHDLRHSFASVATGLGEGLPMIGKLLGHTQAQTTARYAHLAADPVRAAVERIGEQIGDQMRGTINVASKER